MKDISITAEEFEALRKKTVCPKHMNYMAGSAITYGNCKDCKSGIVHSNTFTPNYCLDCAEKDKKCKYCGEKLK